MSTYICRSIKIFPCSCFYLWHQAKCCHFESLEVKMMAVIDAACRATHDVQTQRLENPNFVVLHDMFMTPTNRSSERSERRKRKELLHPPFLPNESPALLSSDHERLQLHSFTKLLPCNCCCKSNCYK